MPRHAAKKQEDKRRLTSNETPALQRRGKSASRSADNLTAQSYQDMADNSPRVKQLKAYQAIADNTKTTGVSSNRGVVQLLLADDLNSKKVNVAIAGEKHHEIPEDLERAAWDKSGIKLHYEADSIPLNDGSGKKVTPDPIKLRLAFGYTALNEYVSPYLESSYKPGKSADVASAKDAAWVLNYILPVLINDLGRRPNSQAKEVDPMIAVLQELRSILKGKKLTSVVGDELARRVLASKVRRDLDLVGDFIGKLHSESASRDVEFKSSSLMVARSQQMLERVNNEAGSMDNTIYKVGNNHVLDMQREKWAPNPKVAVLEKTDYVKEYQTQAGRKAPVAASGQSVVPVSVPVQSPVKPPVSVPKSGAVPVSVPVQSPAKLPVQVPKSSVPVSVPVQSPAKSPVSSEPKRKPKPKVVKPQAPVKSAADVKVERLQAILDAAPADVRTAKGYLEIAAQLAHYKMRLESDDIIRNVKSIIEERNDRWALTKFLVRSKETQQLYDELAAEIG